MKLVKETRASTVDRVSRRHEEKFAERRSELAEAALNTLAELGYAKTSLREIAQNTEFSHGVLHYYFNDKVDLITCCVRQYKAACVRRYDEVVASAKTADELARGFARAMADTLEKESLYHRLWYDIRTQSMFDASFVADVADIDRSLERMIWRIVTEHAALAHVELHVSSSLAYSLFDGVFQQSLIKKTHGDLTAAKHLETAVIAVLTELTVKPAPARATPKPLARQKTAAAIASLRRNTPKARTRAAR